MSEDRTQLKALATRVSDKLIGKNHSGMPAMDHTVVTQLLLGIVGPYNFKIIEREYGGTKKGGEKDAAMLTGVVGRLTCTIDGREVEVEEFGGLENAANVDGNGERGKHAASDALKRCAMRLGLGLHVWADNHYFLDKALDKGEGVESTEPDNATTAAAAPEQPKKAKKPKSNANEAEAGQLDTNKRARIAELVMDVKYPGGIAGFEEKGLKGKKIAELSDKQADKVIQTLEARKEELENAEPEEFDPEDVEGVQKGVPVG